MIKKHTISPAMLAKYLFSIVLTFLAKINMPSIHYLVASFLELTAIGVFSNMLMSKHKATCRIVNDLLMLLYNMQMAVMLFGNSYITMVVLSSLPSVKALSGQATLYISSACVILLFSVLPINRVVLYEKVNGLYVLPIILCIELIFTLSYGIAFSPMLGYCSLGIQCAKKVNTYGKLIMAEQIYQCKDIKEDIYDEIKNYIAKENLTEYPNVILIFTEGLSQNVISDARQIMPNVAEYQKKSLNFINYYNHTFATYRGLIGQLYSGYQLEDCDNNALISIQSILSDHGYATAFLNTEPNNRYFTTYLKNFGFDELVCDAKTVCNGMSQSVSDKDAYEMLFDKALSLRNGDSPFFLAMYTFGTHVSFNSVDEKYGDGSNATLNKFYNLDYQFGKFMDKLLTSSLTKNTIVVFTADHATYQDASFNATFPEYTRFAQSLDEIPLFIYYDGITPETIDVQGRNSINLAPTLLDYLDISAPNYFVGTSLFSGSAASICETSFSDSFITWSSAGGSINEIKGTELDEFQQKILDYYILKSKAQKCAEAK